MITPMLLGMSLGAVSSGNLRVIVGEVQIVGSLPWLVPISLAIGALALSLCAYLAAVYLLNETSGALREDFRRRAFVAGTAVVGLSALTLPLLYCEARHLWDGLISLPALPIVLAGVSAALVSGWALLVRRARLARFAAVAQVICLLAGWGLAQYPYLIYPDITLELAAAPEAMLRFVLITLPFGLAVLLPSLWLLFKVFKGEYLGLAEDHDH